MKNTENNTTTERKKHFCILHSAFCIKDYLSLSYLALIVLFCFAIATSFMSISYMAKYSSASSGNDGGRAAKFVIDVTEDENNSLIIDTTSGQSSAQYAFSVSNNDGISTSEVSQKYSVVMTLPSALPDEITATLEKENGGVIAANISTDKKTYTFAKAGTFSEGTPLVDNFILKFTVNGTPVEEISIVGIHLEVKTEQID